MATRHQQADLANLKNQFVGAHFATGVYESTAPIFCQFAIARGALSLSRALSEQTSQGFWDHLMSHVNLVISHSFATRGYVDLLQFLPPPYKTPGVAIDTYHSATCRLRRTIFLTLHPRCHGNHAYL